MQTKLYLPILRFPSLVPRSRLIEKLEASSSSSRLTLVSAPAGFGKTTLIAEWANSEMVDNICWLSLDENDDDLARFLTYLIAAIASLGGPWSSSSLDQDVIAHYANARPPDVATLLMILINEITAVPDCFVLVLDDYQTVSQSAIHQALAFLLEHMPPNMHIVICTRVDPPLPLPRLRGRGQVSEIRQRDLQFSLEESAQLLEQVTGLGLTAEEVQALAARTEGWPAGLQMAAISLGGSDDVDSFIHDFTGSHRHILDYLLQEVLQGQPQEIQTFLLHTALLDRLTAPLCDALMEPLETQDFASLLQDHQDISFGMPSQLILEQLERSNLFVVPLDNERGWYRYHRLFADLLRFTLRSTMPEKIPLLQRRASRWFEENGFVVPAIDHALAAVDFDRAARLLDEHAGRFLMRGEIALLLRWLDALPDDLLAAWPSLCIYHAWARLLAGRPAAAVEARLLDAQEAGSEGEVSAVALVFESLIALLLGDVRRSLELSRRALEALPAENVTWRSTVYGNMGMAYVMTGDMEAAIGAFEESGRIGQEAGNKMAIVGSLSNLAGLTLARGQLHKSAASYRRALDLATDSQGRRLPVAHRVLLGLGELAREWNDLEAAERYLAESLALSRRFGEMGTLMSLLHLARVKGAQGDIKTADEMFEEARQLALNSEATPLDDLLVEAAQARFWLEQGDLAAAERWVRTVQSEQSGVDGSEPAVQTPYEIREVEQFLLARLALARGTPGEALAKLEPLQLTAEQRGQNRRLIEILNLKAMAQQAGGDELEAVDTIRQALNLAEPEEYIRVFVDAGEAMARLLKRAYSKGIAPDYIRSLLAAFAPAVLELAGPTESKSTIHSQQSTIVEPLSERELEVLQLIAEGLTNREIAVRLVISLSTVKGHTANIYGKLGVHRRTLAVARARELNLLTEPPKIV